METTTYPEDLEDAKRKAVALVELVRVIHSLGDVLLLNIYAIEWLKERHQEARLDQLDLATCRFPKLHTWLNSRSLLDTAIKLADEAITPIHGEFRSHSDAVGAAGTWGSTGHKLAVKLGQRLYEDVCLALSVVAKEVSQDPPELIDVKGGVEFLSLLKNWLKPGLVIRPSDEDRIREIIEGECQEAARARGKPRDKEHPCIPSNDDVNLMRKQIAKHPDGRNVKPSVLFEGILRESAGRKALRVLEGLGEYKGFTKASPKRKKKE